MLQLQQETLKIGLDPEFVIFEEKKEELTSTEGVEEKIDTTSDTKKKIFPGTSSQMIGWRRDALQRNEVERHARGKQDIVKLFKWPREGV